MLEVEEILEMVLKANLRQRHEEDRSVVAQLGTVKVERTRYWEMRIVVEGQMVVAVGIEVLGEKRILRAVEKGRQADHMAEGNH